MEVPQQEIKRCGECVFGCDYIVLKRGTFRTGTRERMRCGIKNNPYLPESLRYGRNWMSRRYFGCPLWSDQQGTPVPQFKPVTAETTPQERERLLTVLRGIQR